MSVAGYIIIGIIIAVVLLVYLGFMLLFISSSISYRKAIRAKATVLENLGNIKLAVGSTGFIPRFRMFHKYKVMFYVDNEQHIEEVELKNCHLQIGEVTEVRYSICENGKLSMESESLLYWSREMAVGYTIGIIFGIVLGVLKLTGVID